MSLELYCERRRVRPKKNTGWKQHQQISKIITQYKKHGTVKSRHFRRMDELIKEYDGHIAPKLQTGFQQVQRIRKELGK